MEVAICGDSSNEKQVVKCERTPRRKIVIVNKPITILKDDEAVIRQYVENRVSTWSTCYRRDEEWYEHFVNRECARFAEKNDPISAEQLKRLQKAVVQVMPKAKQIMKCQVVKVVSVNLWELQKEAKLHINKYQVLTNINKILKKYGMQAGMHTVRCATTLQIYPVAMETNDGTNNWE
jgi:hypothetical protein